MLEAEVQAQIQIEGPLHGCILQRNNSGALIDNTGRPVRFGLGNVSKKHNDQIKSSDLIGITVITITPEMVGKQVGVFTSIEVKEPDWNPMKKLDKHEQAQANWLTWVRHNFGFAGFANSKEMFVNVLKSEISRLTGK